MLMLLVACTPKDTGPDPLAGTVTAESGEVATVSAATAFGVNVGDEAVIVVSPNPDTTCADAAAFVSGGDEDFNPEIVSGVGVCNVFLHLDGYSVTQRTLTDDTTVSIALNCAMDTGEWAFEERTYDGFFYSGPFWVGSPEGYTLTIEGGDDADFTFELAMDTYTGRFPYDNDEPEADSATGAVAGGVTATWCEDLGPAMP